MKTSFHLRKQQFVSQADPCHTQFLVFFSIKHYVDFFFFFDNNGTKNVFKKTSKINLVFSYFNCCKWIKWFLLFRLLNKREMQFISRTSIYRNVVSINIISKVVLWWFFHDFAKKNHNLKKVIFVFPGSIFLQ